MAATTSKPLGPEQAAMNSREGDVAVAKITPCFEMEKAL